jgi:cytochrome c-type biogenesis protein CcmH/NrfG
MFADHPSPHLCIRRSTSSFVPESINLCRGSLANAHRLEPDDPHYTYVYALALVDAEQQSVAISTLKDILEIHPYDRDSLTLLVKLLEAAGNRAEALQYEEHLDSLPRDP